MKIASVADDLLSVRDRDDRWWVVAACLGLCAALPFALYRYLPLVDVPLHQLEFAIWAQPEEFSRYYEKNSYWLPYWLPFFIARPFVPLLGVEVASRIPVILYAFALPLSSGLLARAAGRSAWWGLLLLPFLIEFNLAFGFVSYCLAGMMLQLSLAAGLCSERASASWLPLVGVALVGFAIGATHPQIAVMSVAAHGFLQLLNTKGSYRRRFAIVAASTTALLQTTVWALSKVKDEYWGGKPPEFAPWKALLVQLGRCSIDVFPGTLEEGLLATVVGLLGLAWLQARPSVSWMQWRMPLLAAVFLAAYFVTPWELNGQAIGPRMPYLALLCIPALAPPAVFPVSALRVAIVGIAVVGIAQIALVVRGFDAETARPLDRLAEQTTAGARLAYLGYEVRSPWVNGRAYTHAGAWITLRRGGVYAYNWNGSTGRYRTSVPKEQTFADKEFLLSGQLEEQGKLVVFERKFLSFWDTILVHWPRGRPVFDPLRPEIQQDETAHRVGRWGLLRVSPVPPAR